MNQTLTDVVVPTPDPARSSRSVRMSSETLFLAGPGRRIPATRPL